MLQKAAEGEPQHDRPFLSNVVFYNKCAISFWCTPFLQAVVDYGTDQVNVVMVAQFLFLFLDFLRSSQEKCN